LSFLCNVPTISLFVLIRQLCSTFMYNECFLQSSLEYFTKFHFF
jgi:hypothetical protein